MTTRPITFVHRGRVVEVADAPATRTVLDWLREDARCTGTKEGCAEGDCGACTVLVGELQADGAVALKPVNACLQFVPMLDGKALLTVEDVTAAGAPGLHPVQQALVDCHGSQCGFCTPGFVMSMTALYEQHAAAGSVPTRQVLADALAGNLCRCTGYRPILEAGERMFALPPCRLDSTGLATQLQALQSRPSLDYAQGGQRCWAPRTLDEFAALREAHPEARIVGGATDVALWVSKQFRPLGDLLFIGEVAELKALAVRDDELHIGAAVSLEEAWSALVAHAPALQALWLRFASPPVRHGGTLVGNLANGSPIGDGAPVLMALGARLVLRRGAQQRELPLHDFYVDYLRNQLQPGEFIERAIVPLADAGQVQAHKVSKRYDSDISALCGAFMLKLDDAGRVAQVRLVYGGMAAVVKRATHAEAALRGQPWNEAALQAAQQALAQDYTPLTDQRASAAYRLHAAQQLLRRLWLSTRRDDPLAAAALDVWQGLRPVEVTP